MVSKTEIKETKSSIFTKLYFAFFLLLPFVYTEKTVDPVLIPRQFFLSFFVLITGFLVCREIYNQKLRADISFLKLELPMLLVLFIVSGIISFSKSIALSESFYVLSKMIIEVVFFIITTYLIIQKQLDLKVVAKGIVLFAGISMIVATYQVFHSDASINKELVKSLYANKNLLASVLFLTLPFVLYVSLFQIKRWRTILFLMYFLILLIVWYINTRAVLIAILVFATVLFAGLYKNKKVASKTKANYLWITPICIVVVIVTTLFINFVNAPKQEHGKIDSSTTSAEINHNNPLQVNPLQANKISSLTNTSSALTRIYLWENSVQMIKENLFLGVGLGNWQVHFPKYGLEKFDSPEIKNGLLTYQRPHNDFLWVLCEQGLIGILIYSSIFVFCIYYLIRLIRWSKNDEYTLLYTLLFSSIIGYGFIAMVDFPMERIEHQVFLFLIFSVITAKYYENVQKDKKGVYKLIKLSLAIPTLIISVVFSLTVSFKRYAGEYHSHKLYEYHHKADWGRMINEADKAMNSFYSMDPMSAPIEWYKGVALFTLGNIPAAEKSFEKAREINPYNIHVLNNIASCYETKGLHTQAEKIYLQALAISSEFEEARLNLSAVYYNMKDYEKAFDTIDKCNINSSNPKYYQTYLPAILKSKLELILAKCDKSESIDQIKQISATSDQIKNLYFEAKNKNSSLDDFILEICNKNTPP